MTILITGANRGIGQALAGQWRDAGQTVIATARSAPGMEPLDVTDPASIEALAKRLDGQPISTLVCNAGVSLDKFDELETGYAAEDWAQTFAVNVTGVFLVVQALLANLRASKDAGENPRIAIIASKMGSQQSPAGNRFIYRASKAAAINLGRNLAVNLESEGIAVGIYHPGWIATDMGGESADLTLEDAVPGLRKQIDGLTLSETGCFRDWEGRDCEF
ncbi:NADP-dependent 3-hydroxy acid dehydrogenase YdfG [Marinobacter pelagius]|uniref:NADP-dependent 3-hydroxy acid dehydrogenase YdfG n=1 Tax=Marinobacter pelagius TaxID=379482 RepID=A0A366GXQ0_9GAMM|nr:SDR family NAD(P)-dependent oxidoreductase [Marinobacter pelagius]RBP33401.1 NADP-dependent 3-hydroxy acid dehydrogenase YdfG [Marinobacter pelagius]